MDDPKTKKDSTKSNVVVKYCIYGNPIPLQRPRFSYGHVWDAQKKLKHAWGVQLQQQQQDQFFQKVPLHFCVDFFMPTPRMSMTKMHAYENKWHPTRPDTDNLIKWVLDAANGILYDDDCIVASIKATKRYSCKPRTEFYFKELTQTDLDKIYARHEAALQAHIKNCKENPPEMYCTYEGCPNYVFCPGRCCLIKDK